MVVTTGTQVELYPTYSENIRVAAKRQGLNIRELANRTQFCYEHIRKIWMGRTPKRKDARLTISEDCNNVLCELLGLPAKDMFDLAEREKFSQKTGYAPIQLMDPLGQELVDTWGHLDDDQKQVILRMSRSFAHEMVHVS